MQLRAAPADDARDDATVGPMGAILGKTQTVVGSSSRLNNPYNSHVAITTMLYPKVLEGGVLHLWLQMSSNLVVCRGI